MRLPFGNDVDRYKWQSLNGRVFCMDDEGVIIFVIDKPANWREAMLMAFEAGQLSEVDRHSNYIELLETLCEEMLPDEFAPLDESGLEILVKAKLMNVNKTGIQRMWNEIQKQKRLEVQEEREELKRRVDQSWTDHLSTERAD